MLHKLSQPLSTLRDIILANSIKLGFMPWLTRLTLTGIRCRASLTTTLSAVWPWPSSDKPTSSTSEASTDADAVKDHNVGSTWYSWFDDNLDDFYTADPLADSKPLEPTDLINSLLENQVTLWHHHEFAPWLTALAEQAFYQWPAEIPLDADFTQPKQVSSPETQQKLSRAFSSLPRELVNITHVQEMVLMYLGASYTVIEQFSKTPKAQATAKERENYHQEHYAKRTAFYKQRNMTVHEYIEQHLKLNSTE